MELIKTNRSDVNDFRKDNFIFNVLDSLQPTIKSTGNIGWMRDEELIGKFNLMSDQNL